MQIEQLCSKWDSCCSYRNTQNNWSIKPLIKRDIFFFYLHNRFDPVGHSLFALWFAPRECTWFYKTASFCSAVIKQCRAIRWLPAHFICLTAGGRQCGLKLLFFVNITQNVLMLERQQIFYLFSYGLPVYHLGLFSRLQTWSTHCTAGESISPYLHFICKPFMFAWMTSDWSLMQC